MLEVWEYVLLFYGYFSSPYLMTVLEIITNEWTYYSVLVIFNRF